jgi:hypothetical protein
MSKTAMPNFNYNICKPIQKCDNVKLTMINDIKSNHRWIRQVENDEITWFEYWDGRSHYIKGSEPFEILEKEYQRLMREEKLERILKNV